MKKVFLGLLALLLALMPVHSALALKVVKPGEDAYYLDTANVLSEATEGEIYFCNTLLKEKTGAEIAIVALDSIDGEDTYEYAYTLFNEWGIGSSKENNGFLLLMAIEEDDYYALSGSGVDRIFPASTIKDFYDKYLENDFAAKNYDSGARKFFEAVFEKYADYYNLNITPADGVAAYQNYVSSGGTLASSSGYVYEDDAEDGSSMSVLAVIAIMVLLFVVIRGNTRRGAGSSGSRNHFIFFGSPYRHVRHIHRPHTPPPHNPGPRAPGAGMFGGMGGFNSRPGKTGFGGGRSFSSGAGRTTSRSSGFGSRSFGGGRSGFGGGGFGGGRSSGGGAGRGRR